MQIFVEYLHMKRKQKHTTKIQCNFIERIIVSREARKLTNKRKPKKKLYAQSILCKWQSSNNQIPCSMRFSCHFNWPHGSHVRKSLRICTVHHSVLGLQIGQRMWKKNTHSMIVSICVSARKTVVHAATHSHTRIVTKRSWDASKMHKSLDI